MIHPEDHIADGFVPVGRPEDIIEVAAVQVHGFTGGHGVGDGLAVVLGIAHRQLQCAGDPVVVPVAVGGKLQGDGVIVRVAACLQSQIIQDVVASSGIALVAEEIPLVQVRVGKRRISGIDGALEVAVGAGAHIKGDVVQVGVPVLVLQDVLKVPAVKAGLLPRVHAVGDGGVAVRGINRVEADAGAVNARVGRGVHQVLVGVEIPVAAGGIPVDPALEGVGGPADGHRGRGAGISGIVVGRDILHRRSQTAVAVQSIERDGIGRGHRIAAGIAPAILVCIRMGHLTNRGSTPLAGSPMVILICGPCIIVTQCRNGYCLLMLGISLAYLGLASRCCTRSRNSSAGIHPLVSQLLNGLRFFIVAARANPSVLSIRFTRCRRNHFPFSIIMARSL